MIFAVVIHPDGKIITAGSATLPTVVNTSFILVRCNTDGSLDTMFGTGGKIISDFGETANNFADDATDILILSDGKILIAGDSDGGGYYDFLVASHCGNSVCSLIFLFLRLFSDR